MSGYRVPLLGQRPVLQAPQKIDAETGDGRTRIVEVGNPYAWWIALLALAVGIGALVVAVISISNDHADIHFHDDDQEGVRIMTFDNLYRVDEAALGFDGRPENSYWKASNATGADEDCFTFLPFGGRRVCSTIDGAYTPNGGIDTVAWMAGETGLHIPAHQHHCADEMWQIVNGSCTFWSDSNYELVHNLEEYPNITDPNSFDDYDDFMGLGWWDKVIVYGPGSMYMPRGTQFSWECAPDTYVWTSFTPGGNGGIIRAFATQIFGPDPYYPVTQETIRQVENLFCTRFIQAALDQAGLPFGTPDRPNAYPWSRKINNSPTY